MIGLLFFFLGTLIALASLIGIGFGVDDKSIMAVLLFYGLGLLLAGVPLPAWPRRTE